MINYNNQHKEFIIDKLFQILDKLEDISYSKDQYNNIDSDLIVTRNLVSNLLDRVTEYTFDS